METTFITINDLSPDANILYSSDSIIDILGYTPDEVVNRPCWNYFHPDELPLARKIHSMGVTLDKAASLSYCRLRNRDSQWVCCECVFTVVYDVLVGCISIYRRSLKSEERAAEVPIIRRLFSSSPRDPRYHMLSHLSPKFLRLPKLGMHEPSAALLLNRFTRTLTIMYATNGLQDLLGICSEDLKGRSFYRCIHQKCLEDALKCLESAKANDSIANLRFWYRDPRRDDEPQSDTFDGQDEEMQDFCSSEDESEGGVRFWGHTEEIICDREADTQTLKSRSHELDSTVLSKARMDVNSAGRKDTPNGNGSGAKVHGQSNREESWNSTSPRSPVDAPIELEAVVSCTFDGLVVYMRHARPIVPYPIQRPTELVYVKGLFTLVRQSEHAAI